jgi:hypothetical protein
MAYPETGTPEWINLKSADVEIMLQTRESLTNDLPVFSNIQIGSSSNLFIIVENIDLLYKNINKRVEIGSDIQNRFYGMREFSAKDPDGYIITFAEEIKKQEV